jgi:hypothetical protein
VRLITIIDLESLHYFLDKEGRFGELNPACSIYFVGLVYFNGGGVDMAFLKHVPLNVEAMFSIVWAYLLE